MKIRWLMLREATAAGFEEERVATADVLLKEYPWRLAQHLAGDANQAKGHSLGWSSVLGWLQSFVEKGETVDNRK